MAFVLCDGGEGGGGGEPANPYDFNSLILVQTAKPQSIW